MQSVYLTWMISALALGVLLLPVFKPPWARLSLPPFVDFFRRYWVHIFIVFAIYNAKDVLDQMDRLLMASTGAILHVLFQGDFLFPSPSRPLDAGGLRLWGSSGMR